MENWTKTLLERIGVDDRYPTADLHPPSDAKLTRHSMLGKSKNYSPLPLSRRILSVPTLWSRITLQTLNMPYGCSSPAVSSCLSQNRNGNMSLQGWWSTLTSSSLDSFPPSPKTKPWPQSETLISPLAEVSPRNMSKPMATGPLLGIPPSLQSYVPSCTVPWNCESTLSTYFSFSEPFPTHTPKSLTLTKQPVITLGRLSTSNCNGFRGNLTP